MNRDIYKSFFSLLNADCVELDSNWNYKNTTSTFFRIYFINSGEGKLYNHDKTILLEEGYLYLIPSFTNHNSYCPQYLNQYYLHFIEESQNGWSLFSANRAIIKTKTNDTDKQIIKRIIEINPNRGLKLLHNPKLYEKRPVLQSFNELNNATQLSTFVETQGLILQLISRFLTCEHFKSNYTNLIDSKILNAINYIQTNLNANITVTELSDRANHNPDYFSRLFSENTGERPLVYIRHRRIERAQILLTTTDLTLYQIADETGFEDLSYFSKTFKKITGKTPSHYRQNNEVV